MKCIISIIFFFLSPLFSQYEIDGRWHLVGYEDNVMYQFENNYRYSIYSLDGVFGDLEDAGGSPNPYTVIDDIITIDLFFGNIVNYQMNFICYGQVVEFIYIEGQAVHSILFKEGFNYIDNDCQEDIEVFGDFNFDENVDVLDVIILVNHILSPAAVELENSDLNNDGNVNVSDVVLLIDLILN
tara:strand:+ start:1742 stop:2293 length:552 start_codon:yes stop_codon:yes gene_type:complete